MNNWLKHKIKMKIINCFTMKAYKKNLKFYKSYQINNIIIKSFLIKVL